MGSCYIAQGAQLSALLWPRGERWGKGRSKREEIFFKAPLREVLYWNDFENIALHSLQETESTAQHIKQILQQINLFNCKPSSSQIAWAQYTYPKNNLSHVLDSNISLTTSWKKIVACMITVRFKYALVTQSCPTLWESMDCSPPGSSVHGIL